METHPAARWQIGRTNVHRVDEIQVTGLARTLLPDATPAVVAEVPWLPPSSVDGDGELIASVHTFAIEVDGQRILVDTGVGNDKARPNPAWDHLTTPFPDRLAAAGFPPESVDLVINTHLHMDHVGWNTRLDNGTWRPTFPNARYLMSRTEYAYWDGAELPADRRELLVDSVHPVRDAGLLDLLDVPDDGVEVATGLRLLPAPGHTPGQLTVRIDSAGSSALITADCLHHPVQLARPGIGCIADTDPAMAARTRAALLASVADTGTLLLGSHFTHPTGGHVRRDGTAFRLDG
ncbi:MBL fold metallo-hydrolase [Streptomyces sp. NPDC003753]|uniref:MBL fold metallo-hydrolase n=1 Tax=Streptomyces sp. NPDC058960 TaxID=3346679 RepID=UPI0036BD6486